MKAERHGLCGASGRPPRKGGASRLSPRRDWRPLEGGLGDQRGLGHHEPGPGRRLEGSDSARTREEPPSRVVHDWDDRPLALMASVVGSEFRQVGGVARRSPFDGAPEVHLCRPGEVASVRRSDARPSSFAPILRSAAATRQLTNRVSNPTARISSVSVKTANCIDSEAARMLLEVTSWNRP